MLEAAPRIGELLDELIARAQRQGRRIAEALLALVERGELDPLYLWVFRNHVASGMLAWSLHSSWLAIPSVPPVEAQRALAEVADGWGRTVISRAAAVMGSGEPPVSPRLYMDLLADITVRRGWAEGSAEAGRAGGATRKTWVRVYPVRRPRDWHARLEGTTIPVNARFTLPGGPNAGAQVDGPHDWDTLPDPREWVNCGHGLVYS